MTKTPAPSWLSTAVEEYRMFNGSPVRGWAGYVNLDEIAYWEDNRRTEATLARHRRKQKTTQLSDQQVFFFLQDDPDIDIESLARDICLNGLRSPLVLDYNKSLLDGNRRYLAHCWIMKNGDANQRNIFNKVAVWVLSEEFSDARGRLRVVTQYNFLTDFRKKWTDLVKAKLLYEEYNDSKSDYTIDDLYDMYGGPGFTRHKIREFIKTYEIIARYMEYCPNEDDAFVEADEHFIWFQQLQRSYSDIVRNDDEFRDAIFKNILDGSIATTDDLKNLRGVKDLPEAWKEFRKGDVKQAHHLRRVDEHDRNTKAAPDKLLTEINSRLDSLLAQTGTIERVSQEVRDRFQELAEQVPGQIGNVDLRVSGIVRQLRAITSSELTMLSPSMLEQLDIVLEQVVRQARATRNG